MKKCSRSYETERLLTQKTLAIATVRKKDYSFEFINETVGYF